MTPGLDPRFVEVWFSDGSALELDVDAQLRQRPGVAEALTDWLMSMPARAAAADALRHRLEPLGLGLRIRRRRARLELEVQEAPIESRAVGQPGRGSSVAG